MRYVPTDELVADILTKPLVGSKFRYLRGKLLGVGTTNLMRKGGVLDFGSAK